MVCPNCNKDYGDRQIKFCPFCGTKIDALRAKPNPEPKQEPKPEPRPEPKPEPRPEPKPEPKPEPRPQPQQEDFDVRSVWSDLEIQSQASVGRGSVVYRAMRKDTFDTIAVKVLSVPADPAQVTALRSAGQSDDSIALHFSNLADAHVRKLQQMQTLNGNPSIVGIQDCRAIRISRFSWKICVRMEWLKPFGSINFGDTVKETAVVKLGVDLCNAVEALHQQQIVHGNIKPENIFLDRQGKYKLSDCGSPLTETRVNDYAAPEVSQGQMDMRSDLYAIGLVLYQLLNARQLPSPQLRTQGTSLPTPCNASANMARFLAMACAYNPSERFASAGQMREALIKLGKGGSAPKPAGGGTPKPAGGGSRPKPAGGGASDSPKPYRSYHSGSRRNPLMIILIIVLALAVVAGLVFGAIALFSKKDKDPASEAPAISQEEPTRQEDKEDLPDIQDAPETEPSQETEPPRMPDCIGMHYSDAAALFVGTGCTPIFEYAYSDTIAADCVMEQALAQGSELPTDGLVVLVVSKGEDKAPEGYDQKVVVTAASGSSYGTLTLYEWENGEWVSRFSCDTTVGQRGIGTNYGEGKRITPQGIFKLGVALSANSIPNDSWPFYQVSSSTCVVDDVDSAYYNTIQNKNDLPSGVSYDSIGRKLTNGTNNVLLYIEHNGDGFNSDGVEPGKCSVITVCGCSASIKPTFGCVDISKSNMNTLLELLDYDKNPHIEISVR